MSKSAAIVLAAGQGKRMHSSVQKQFLLLDGKPLIFYGLDAFENSPIDQIVLVTGLDEKMCIRDRENDSPYETG